MYWVGGLQVIDGTLSLGTLVALAAYVTRLYGPLTALSNAHVDLLTAMVSFERVFEVLDAPLPLVDRPGAVDLAAPRGRIELDDVHFAYPDQVIVPTLELDPTIGVPPGPRRRRRRSPVDGNGGNGGNGGTAERAGAHGDGHEREVLHGVSAIVEPGQLVALVGPSGGGKTTLSMLVPRLYDVTDGAVRVDGHDVRDLTQDSLHAAIGAVTQDPHLFHDTVGNNLRYARPDATDDELVAAARAAQIHDVIAALPEGYDTLVGERGYRLSGGEKQRLAIARMLLKDPAIVILDEATSQLDSENEAAIQRALAEALGGPDQPRHRPPPVDDHDRRPDPGARRRPHRRARHATPTCSPRAGSTPTCTARWSAATSPDPAPRSPSTTPPRSAWPDPAPDAVGGTTGSCRVARQ